MTVPLVVIIALALAALSGTGGSNSHADPTAGALPALTPPAPPHAAAMAGPCARVLEQLPVSLNDLAPRIVHSRPDSPFVVAWGDPAVVLSCGADRPRSLRPGSAEQYFVNGPARGPYYDVSSGSSGNVWTTVDRAVYIAIEVPTEYDGADVVPPLSEAIARALPPVCSTAPDTPDPATLCTRRSR